MNKNARMWLIGIVVALIVILLIAGAVGSANSGTGEASPSGSSAEGIPGTMSESGATESQTSQTSQSGQMSHDHGQMAGGTDPLSRYLTEQDSIMMAMMEDMIIRERSGSAAVDFLKGMIPHHEAAVRMSESYLNYGGESEELKTLAEDIITAQKAEIVQMKEMIAEYEANGDKDDANEDAYLEKYSEMFSDDSMSHHINPEGVTTVDQAFAEGMIMHHQMAVDMARDILDYTEEKEVRELAENIIELQEKEIAQMEKLAQ